MVYFFLFLIVAVATAGIVYIYYTFKINKTYIQARDAAAYLDSCLFEKYHMLKKLNDIMAKAKLDTEPVTMTKIQIRFDMTVAEERMVFNFFKECVPHYEEAKASLNNPDFDSILDSYKEYDAEIIKAIISMDKTTEVFNQSIAGFPAEQIAARKKKYSRAYFDIDTVS